jgi:hypothetical protein
MEKMVCQSLKLFFPTTIFVKWNVFDCSDADESFAFGSRRGCRNRNNVGLRLQLPLWWLRHGEASQSAHGLQMRL